MTTNDMVVRADAVRRHHKGTTIVFWGHVLRWQDAPELAAPGARLEELKSGAALEVITADGTAWRYRVVQQLRAQLEDVHLLDPTLTERVPW